MRRLLIRALLLIGSTGALAVPAVDNAPVIGIWKAQVNSLPMMTLTIEQENGRLIGAVLFYLIRRNPGAPETASAGAPEPLIDPTFDGKTLSFKVSHRHAHPGTEHDPPVAFRFDVGGDGKIRFAGPDGQQVEMLRETPY